MSYGKVGSTPNAYLVYVVALGSIPGQTLSRLIVNDEYVPVDGAVDGDGMTGVTGTFEGYVRVRYYDGTQTTADPLLLDKFGADPDRPWTADMIGAGVPYAVVVFKYKRDIFNGLPTLRFECGGLPLYDPRADSTVGGSGAQRWVDPASWVQTTNPAVIIYNIKRGIRLPDGNIWGGESSVEELPLSNWFAAMNECDVAIALEAGGSEPQYRAGFEVSVDEEPADIIDELLKACSGQVTEIGGTWKIRVGGPGLPVFFFTDDDILIDQDQMFEPFSGLESTYNGVHASYPEPDSLWESKDAPPRYDAALELADQGRRLIADLTLPAVPWSTQVQRLMQAYINEERRFRRHHCALPPEAAVLEPLDTVAWTSDRHGYAAKQFEVFEITDDLATLTQTTGLRERDPADYGWLPGDELPSGIVPPGLTAPLARVVPGFAVVPGSVTDSDGIARRPAIVMTWTGQEADDSAGLSWEIRVKATGAIAARGATFAVAGGQLIVSEGLLPLTEYEVRAELAVALATAWTGWLSVTTPDVRLGAADISTAVMSEISAAQVDADAAAVQAAAALVKASAVEETSQNALVLRPIGGTGAANIRIVEWADETGVGSAIVLAGDNVIAPGTLSARSLVVHDNSAVFSEVFETTAALDGWESINGPGEIAVVAASISKMGGHVLRAGDNASNDQVWLVSKTLIPFDPARTYRLKAGVYQLNGSANKVYLGFLGVAADGVTKVSKTGSDSYTSGMHWHGQNAGTPAVAAYTEYAGYTKGHGATVGTGVAGTLATPGQMHPDVRYLRPVILVNYSGQTGMCAIDYVQVDTVSDATLIENGSITAEKIVAGSITVDKLSAGEIITGGMIVGGAVSKVIVKTKDSGSSQVISANSWSSAAIVIDSFATPFIPEMSGGGPVEVTFSGEVAAVTSTAELKIVVEKWVGGIWSQIVPAGMFSVFHTITSAMGTNAHLFSYSVIYSDGYEFSGTLRIRAYVTSAAPFSSHRVRIDALTVIARQLNK